MTRKTYQKSYAWEEKPISDLSPGDILVSSFENGKPHSVVNGTATTGRQIVPDRPESEDFIFVPVRRIEPGWDSGRLVYAESAREGIYQVFSQHNETTAVATTGKDIT